MSYGSVDGLENEAQVAQVEDQLKIRKATRLPNNNQTINCLACDEEIPERRRKAVPGVRYCIECQRESDASTVKLVAKNPYMP